MIDFVSFGMLDNCISIFSVGIENGVVFRKMLKVIELSPALNSMSPLVIGCWP